MLTTHNHPPILRISRIKRNEKKNVRQKKIREDELWRLLNIKKFLFLEKALGLIHFQSITREMVELNSFRVRKKI